MSRLKSLKKLKGPYSYKISDVKTGAWRRARPIINNERCVRCGICAEYCPCGVIEKEDYQMVIDYTYCKGCGICMEECPKKAVSFQPEAEFEGGGEK
jgi:pyruvate ferredoxin oxidoreductase delta subunit